MSSLMNLIFGVRSALADGTAAAGAAAPAGATGMEGAEAASLLSLIIPMALMFVLFYFLLIRPQRKKDKKVKEMLNNLKVGDRICTIGGIYGTITGIRDDTIILSVGTDNVKLVFARWAIRNVEEIKIENDAEVLN